MLNISDNHVTIKNITKYKSIREIMKADTSRRLAKVMMVFLVIGILILFLPWTQSVPVKGEVTTLMPEDRPQSVYSTIAGRIDKW